MKKLLVLLVLLPFLYACGESADSDRMDTILALTPDTEAGKVLYDTNCASCHAADGSGTSLGDNIQESDDERDVLDIVIVGEHSMPA